MEKYALREKVDYKKGFAFSSKDYTSEGTQLVRVSDFTLDSVSTADAIYIHEKKEYEVHKLKEGDILIQTVGSWANNPQSIVGKVVRVPAECEGAYLNQNIVKLLPRDVDADYLFYMLKANKFSLYCVNRGQGAANQASITLDTILKFKCFYHDKNEQKEIAAKLKQYDNLIVCNTKRIKILEQMAENLYKEWFVRFRFPGHEDAEFENGIPKGWEIHRLGEISDFAYGKMPSQEHLLEDEEGYPIFSGYRVNGYYDSYMYEDSKLVLIARGVGGTGDVAKSPPKSYITNLSIIFNLKNETLLKEYLYQRFKIQNLRYLDTGAAQSQITIDNLRRVKVIIPTEHILCDYKKINNSISCEMRIINQKNENLIRQRDLLLPRLMSGKLEIK